MASYKVVIPEEEFGGFEFEQYGKPGIANVNIALDGFEPKVVFSWHCSVLIDYNEKAGDGLPSSDHRKVLASFEQSLDYKIKAKGNAMFLARVTNNGQQELVWRVYNPELANDVLARIIEEKEYPMPFDYRIDPDKKWGKASWFLENSRS